MKCLFLYNGGLSRLILLTFFAVFGCSTSDDSTVQRSEEWMATKYYHDRIYGDWKFIGGTIEGNSISGSLDPRFEGLVYRIRLLDLSEGIEDQDNPQLIFTTFIGGPDFPFQRLYFDNRKQNKDMYFYTLFDNGFDNYQVWMEDGQYMVSFYETLNEEKFFVDNGEEFILAVGSVPYNIQIDGDDYTNVTMMTLQKQIGDYTIMYNFEKFDF